VALRIIIKSKGTNKARLIKGLNARSRELSSPSVNRSNTTASEFLGNVGAVVQTIIAECRQQAGNQFQT
jgi:hypothetical protein